MRARSISIFASALALPLAASSAESQFNVTIATLHAEGAQVYQCQADDAGRLTWQFREPIATLFEGGRTVGRHYAGPSWELADGTILTATVIARSPGTNESDIPWLRLKVHHASGNGAVAETTIVRRHTTKGGFLRGSCGEPGTFMSVPYSAEYTFLKELDRPFFCTQCD